MFSKLAKYLNICYTVYIQQICICHQETRHETTSQRSRNQCLRRTGVATAHRFRQVSAMEPVHSSRERRSHDRGTARSDDPALRSTAYERAADGAEGRAEP